MIKRTLLALALLGAIAACTSPASTSSPTTPGLESQAPVIESPGTPAESPMMESPSMDDSASPSSS